MSILFGAFMMTFFAEMGDKSQFLAFSFANRYPVKLILLAIFFATLICNGTAIFLGNHLGNLIELKFINILSALIFIGFGIWTTIIETSNNKNNEKIKSDHKSKNIASQKNNITKNQFLPILSFFLLAELGDKTQIAGAAYAATFGAPFLTLGGVLVGMILADAIGIFLGYKLREKIPEKKLKLFSGFIFIMLGILTMLSLFNIPGLTIFSAPPG